METILRFLNKRSFAIAGGVVALVAAAVLLLSSAREDAESRRLEAERGALVAADILRENEARESLKLRSLHRAVTAEIAAAAARGFDGRRLQSLADAALSLDAPQTRALATERLNRLRLSVPKRHETMRPAAVDEYEADSPAARPTASRAARPR